MAPSTVRGLMAVMLMFGVSFGFIGVCVVWIICCLVATYLSIQQAVLAWYDAFPPGATVYLSSSAMAEPSLWGKLVYVLQEEVSNDVWMLWVSTITLIVALALTLRHGLLSKAPQMGRRGYRLNRKSKANPSALASATYVDSSEMPSPTARGTSLRIKLLAWMYTVMGRWYVRYHDHYVVFAEEEEIARTHGTDNLEDSIKKTYFPDDRNYIFGYHPHGCLGSGFWATFQMHYFPTTEELSANEPSLKKGDTTPSQYFTAERRRPFSAMRRFLHKYVVHGADIHNEDFPVGTRKFLLTGHTLFSNFIVPVWREFVLYVGFRDVSKGALLNNLEPVADMDKARMCALVPGGAVESLDCTDPGKLAIRSRKGFVKLCVQTGSSVVPVYTFGETEVWSDLLPEALLSHGAMRSMQRKLQKLLTFAIPMVRGRWGVMIPKNHRLTTVFGKPIKCTATAQTDPKFIEEVNRVHDAYIAELCDIYKRFQPVFDPACPYKELRI